MKRFYGSETFRCKCGCHMYTTICWDCGTQYGLNKEGEQEEMLYKASPTLRMPSLNAWLYEFMLLLDTTIFLVSLSLVETNFFSTRLNKKR